MLFNTPDVSLRTFLIVSYHLFFQKILNSTKKLLFCFDFSFWVIPRCVQGSILVGLGTIGVPRWNPGPEDARQESNLQYSLPSPTRILSASASSRSVFHGQSHGSLLQTDGDKPLGRRVLSGLFSPQWRPAQKSGVSSESTHVELPCGFSYPYSVQAASPPLSIFSDEESSRAIWQLKEAEFPLVLSSG